MRPLYDIGSDLEQLRAAMEESPDGELPPELDAWFAGLEQEEGQKLDSYISLMKQIGHEAEACEKESETWLAKGRTRANALQNLKNRLKLHLQRTGRSSITTPGLTKISLCKNGGKRPLEIFGKIPWDSPYIKTVTESFTDTEKIRQDLEAGIELPFAKLEEPGQHLRIK